MAVAALSIVDCRRRGGGELAMPMESVPGLDNLEQWPPPANGRKPEVEALPVAVPTARRGFAVEPWRPDPRIVPMPAAAPDPRIRPLPPDRRGRQEGRMRTFVQDPAVRASGRMRDYRGEPDPRIREIPVGQLQSALGEILDVRDFGALGERLVMTGSMDAGSPVLRLAVVVGGPTVDPSDDDPLLIERAAKQGRKDKPIKPELPLGRRATKDEEAFRKWRPQAGVGVAQAAGNGASLRGRVVSVDEGQWALTLDVVATVTVRDVRVWNDDSLPIQAALSEAGRRAEGPRAQAPVVVRIPRGSYPLGVPLAKDNLPLRIWSRTTVEGDGPGSTVLVLADEVNQRLDFSVADRRLQAVAATVMTNRESGVYVFQGAGGGQVKVPPPDREITIRQMTLDGNRDGQSLVYTRGGNAAIWRDPSAIADREMASLSPWVKPERLVRWGSGERSVEVMSNGKAAGFYVAVSLFLQETGEESTAAIWPEVVWTGPSAPAPGGGAMAATVGEFEVILHHLPQNSYLGGGKRRPTLRVYVAPAKGGDIKDGSRYVLTHEIPGISAGTVYRCPPKKLPQSGPRPPGCLSFEDIRKYKPAAQAASVSAVGLQLDNVRQVVVEDVEVRNCAEGGIYVGSQVEGAEEVTLRRVDLHGFRWFAMVLAFWVRKLTLQDCTIWDSECGIDVEDVQRVEELTLRRVAIVECLTFGLQLVPPIPRRDLTKPFPPLDLHIRNVKVLGCAFIGNQVHIHIANGNASYQDPGDLSGLVIDQDDGVGLDPNDQARNRKTLMAWAQGRAMEVKALATHGRLRNAIFRKNGFPKVRFYGTFGPLDDPQFRSPMAPHHVAAPLPSAGRNSSTILFSGFLPPPDRPKLPGQGGPWQAPGVGRGPYDWEISGNEIEVNRFSQFSPVVDNNFGIIEIAEGLVVAGEPAFAVEGNVVRPATPLPGLILVTFFGRGGGTILVGRNEPPSPKTMNDWEYRDFAIGSGQRF